jgi:hypothetical protein
MDKQVRPFKYRNLDWEGDMTQLLLSVAALVAFASAAQADTRTFSSPRLGGARLDWCLQWSASCGKPAADAYCRSRGFAGAINFSQARGVGRTRLISGGACNGPTCAGFGHITCAG